MRYVLLIGGAVALYLIAKRWALAVLTGRRRVNRVFTDLLYFGSAGYLGYQGAGAWWGVPVGLVIAAVAGIPALAGVAGAVMVVSVVTGWAVADRWWGAALAVPVAWIVNYKGPLAGFAFIEVVAAGWLVAGALVSGPPDGGALHLAVGSPNALSAVLLALGFSGLSEEARRVHAKGDSVTTGER